MRLQKYLSSAVVGIALLIGGTSAGFAATANNLFDVTVSVTSACRAKDSGTKTLDFGTYVAFGPAVTPASPVDIQFECTRGFAPTSAAITGGNFGVVGGLNYTLTVGAAATTGGTAPTPTATPADPGGNGTPDLVSYSISGNMVAGQAGTNGAVTPDTRTLVLTY